MVTSSNGSLPARTSFAAFRDRLERDQRYRDALPAGTDAASQAEVDRALGELRVGSDRAAGPAGLTADEVAKQVVSPG